MRRCPILLLLCFLSTLLIGCNSQFMKDVAELKNRIGEVRNLETRIGQQESEIIELKKTIARLSQEVESNAKQLAQVRSGLDLHLLRQDPFKSATFDPASGEGFFRLDTSIGSFAVSVQDVKPHADGVKVRLHVGNLTTATVNGGTFKVKWGLRMPSFDEKQDPATGGSRFMSEDEFNKTLHVREEWFRRYDDWQGSLKEKKLSFTDVLRPASWNSVTLMLPGTQPQNRWLSGIVYGDESD